MPVLGPNEDFHVLIQQGDEAQQTLCGKPAQLEMTQFRNMRLGNAENNGGGRLGQLSFLDQAVKAGRQLYAHFALPQGFRLCLPGPLAWGLRRVAIIHNAVYLIEY